MDDLAAIVRSTPYRQATQAGGCLRPAATSPVVGWGIAPLSEAPVGLLVGALAGVID
jgi:hypothetical protein